MISARFRSHLRNAARLRCQRDYHELSYASHGEPDQVLSYQAAPGNPNDNVPTNIDDHAVVKVEMLHVPWNPADVNAVQGRYASPYTAPGAFCKQPHTGSLHFDGCTVAGSEGWGRVVSTQSAKLPEGSLVTVAQPGMGTMRSSFWAPESAFLSVSEELWDRVGPAGSTLFQLGGTALRMLSDFAQLKQGDVVIQNAGNSGVSLMASQLAPALFDVPMVSLVRRGSKSEEELNDMVEFLMTVGKNALVLVEEDLDDRQSLKDAKAQIMELSGSGKLPTLALNSVGGDSANKLLQLLGQGGNLVTYGAMSRQPVAVGAAQFIFSDIRCSGFWHSRWLTVQPDNSTKQAQVDTLVDSVLNRGVVLPTCKTFGLQDVQDALEWQAGQGAIRSKLVWDCQEGTP